MASGHDTGFISWLKCKRLLMRNLLFVLLSFISFSVFSQSELTSGRITNPRGEPVSFATVTVKGTKNSAVAQADGSFKIKASAGQTLVVTAASYSPREYYVNQLSGIDVVLQPGR